MATIQYARLYPDTTQLQAKDGHNLTAGWVEVYLAGTDDPAITYADFNGTRNPQKIIVDDNGRFCAIVDKSKAYRVEVYDEDGMLQWATEPVWCTGNAGAGMSVTKVVSTDGSIAVEENIDGSERTYDLSIAPSDSDEFLEWIKCSEEDCGSTWYPVYQAGTMETEAGQGIKVHAGQLYHFTNTFYVDPNGTGINYDTFKVMMYCNDEIVDVRDFDIDSSLNDSVMCEFSTDLIPEADGVVYYKLTIPSTCEVTAEVQCHRIYSGINAVPDTCATKQWVQEAFDYNMAEKISYSALEYNNNGDISGISGSAIAGGLDSAAVSAIASSYAESAISSISGWSGDFSSISSKIDWSSSGVFQPSGDYQTAGDYAYNSSLSSKVDQSAFEQCCDEVHSALDEKLDKSASSEFQPSGQYVYESAYSSFTIDVTNNISSLTAAVSGIAADMSSYVPFSGLEGEGGKVTGISGSAFKGHEYTGINPVTVDNTADTISVEHRTLCVDSTMTAYNSGSSAVIGVNVAGLDISSKMDASASSLFYPTSNPSGFLTAHQSLAGYATEAYVDSSVSSKLDTTAFSTVSGDFLTSHQSLAGYATESYVDSAVSGKLDVTATSQFLTSLPDDLAYTSDVASAVSGKMDKSESSSFYPMDSNPSGYLTAHQSLAGYATIEYVDSAVSGKLDATAYDSAEFYTTANPSGFVDAASASSIASAYQVVTSVGTSESGPNTVVVSINSNHISAQRAKQALEAQNDLLGRAISSLPDSAAVSAIASSYAESAASSKLDDSATADFYGTANPSGFIDGTSASAIASAYQVVSATATQLNAGTAYLTSVNETPISAARAGNAANASLANSAWYDGTGRMISALPDEATVSSIASSYAESAASGKLDSTAYDSAEFYTTSNPSGFVDSAYVESQVSGKQNSGNYISAKGLTQTISNEDNSLQVSFGSDDETAYGSKVAGLFITGSFGTAYYKDNELNLYRKYMRIAFNIGNQGPKISAMATGTNHPYMYLFASGKNSAVYSDTGIEFKDSGDNTVALYDSSTYDDITSVYDTVSANSATWGQGGADSSAMSAIASSYAESAEANCWPLSASDIVRSTGNGFTISYGNAFFTVSPIAGGSTNPGYLKYQYAGWPTADFGLSNSAVYGGNTFLGTSYYFLLTKSGISGRYLSGNPASAFYWQYTKDEYDNLTSVTETVSANSATWGQGGGGSASIPFNGYYYDSATSATVEITADVSAVSSMAYVKHDGTVVNTYKGIYDTMGINHLGVASFVAPGAEINGKNAGGIPYTMSFAPGTSMWTTADAATGIFSPLQYGTGAGMFMESNDFRGYLKGNEWFVSDDRYGYARGETHNSRGCRVIVEHTGGAGAVLSARGRDANVALNSTAYGTAKMAVGTSQAYVQVQRGNSAYKYNSAKLDTDYLKFYAGMTTGYLDPEDTASGTAYMPAETEYMYISSIPYWNAKLDASAIECDTASAITAIGGSSIAGGGGGGVDSATVSAIASAYVESGVSSKLDTTAQVVTSIGETYPATGGTFISQINGTNIFAVTAHSAGDWIGASSKVDQTAYDNLYSAFTALSDIISTYSAYFSSISAKVDNSAIGVI